MRALIVASYLTLAASAATASELNLPPGMDGPMPSDTVTFVFVGDGGGGLTREDALAAVEASVGEWNAVTCSDLEVQMGEPVATLSDVPEEAVPIRFTNLADPCFPDRDEGDQPIGFTVVCPDYPAPTILLNGETYRWSDSPVPFQSIDEPGSAPVVDARSVIVHEMGHALRLPHVDDPIATMYARYRRDGSQATLSAADDLLLCSQYGGGESECSEDSDCETGACLVAEEIGACDSFRGETGDFCSWDVLECGGQCFFSSPATGTGYCSETCAGDEDCPDRMKCEETSNGQALCQFEFGPADPSTCSTGGANRAGDALLLVVLFGVFNYAKRRRYQ